MYLCVRACIVVYVRAYVCGVWCCEDEVLWTRVVGREGVTPRAFKGSGVCCKRGLNVRT